MENGRKIDNEVTHWQKSKNRKTLEWYWSSPAGKLRFGRRVKLFKNFLGNRNQKVLEIGCGTGILTTEIAHTRNEIIAIDISPDLIEAAKRKIQAANILFKIDNAYKTSFESNYFDAIVGISTLHHLDIDKALQEFYRLLKPGGKLLFSEPNMLNPQVFVERHIPFIRKMMGNTPDETAFFKWKIRRQFLNSGYKKVEVTPFDFLHPAFPGFLLNILKPVVYACERVPLLKEIAGSLLIKAEK